MTDVTKTSAQCSEVDERMVEILDGTAPEALFDHIADCDACRDARHDAERLIGVAASAGADYRPPADLESRVLAELDKRGTGTAEAVSGEPRSSTERPTTGSVKSSEPMAYAETTLASLPERGSDAAPSTARGVGPAAEIEPAPTTARMNEPERAPTTERLPGEGAARVSAPAPTVADEPTPPVRREPAKTELAPEPPIAAKQSVMDRPRVITSNKRRWLLGGGVAGALAAAAVGVLVVRSQMRGAGEDEADGWRGKVVKVASASGKDEGLELCDPSGESCKPLAKDQPVPSGSLLKTDARTRAHLEMADGTQVVLDRDTRLALSGDTSRRAKLEAGAIVADVAHKEDQKAWFGLPKGHVVVLGTKFALRASQDSTAVDVSRGAVELVDGEGRKVTVRAGEEGRLFTGMPPYVSSAPALGEALAWSEATIAEREQDDVVVRGLGELKAKKPSNDQELSGAVTLTSHKVKVRIAGAIARTEVDETFQNHTDDVLEGIFRFPIPPDAKIERLALEVDGKLEEGAFLDRERAAAIWRGAIVNAAPQRRQQIRDEIVWVPGPWKDPALLEWQRGGRFELRIYPIPKRGSRRVVLAYTQVLEPTGGVRRYNYPLAHDPSGSTKVDDFQVDVQVRGHDTKFGVSSQGYTLAKSNVAGAEELKLAQRDFVPSGDLTVEFALPNRDAELTAWAYRPAAGEQKKLVEKPAAALKPAASGAEPADKPKADDDKAYVAIALRPKLPRRQDDAKRTFAVIVDSSRSMFGESYRRASAVAVKTIRELDPGDRFTLLACDTDCRALPGGLQTPGAQAATDAKRFLDGIAPEGGSDPTAAVRNARSAVSGEGGRDLRIVYIGDGTPTVGPIRPAYVTRAVQDAVPPGGGTVTAIAIGADSDLDTLGAMARGGGGVVLPFVPGQSTAEAAYAVLGATYGNALRDVRVELPAGLTEVAPKELDTIIGGSEEIVVARMDKSELEGTVVLRGKLGKESFEQRYPLKLVASESKGNAFVPRLFAATRISDLEREAAAEAKKEAIRLSSEFDVASRYTSLLVLESEAMFKAFGLDRTRSGHEWSGEEEAEVATAQGIDDVGAEKEDAPGFGARSVARGPSLLSGDDGFGAGATSSGGGFSPPAKASRPKPAFSEPAPTSAPAPQAPPPAEIAEDKKAEAATPFPNRAERRRPPSWRDRGRVMVPMRRIFERKGTIQAGVGVPASLDASAIAEAQRAVEREPNRRENVKKLFVLHALAGDIDQASSVAERWSEKEPLDPDALTARADLAARGGDRELAIRVLGSVVDVRPGDVASQKRLARLHRWAGRPAVGCRHTMAIAQLRSSDAALLAEAVSCARQTGESRLASDMLGAAEERVRKLAEAQISSFDKAKDELSGDLRVEATWVGAGHDLDIALIDPDGNRVSWLGAPTKSVISAVDVTSTSREGLALRNGTPGEYVVEIVRGSGSGPVRGDITLNVAGTRRTIPFSLDGVRQTVGIAKIAVQSRLVPLDRRVW